VAWRARRPDLAGAADSLAAQDIRTSVDPDASDPAAERARAWADGVPIVEASVADLLAAPLPEPDYQHPERETAAEGVRVCFTSEDAVEEAQAQDPAKMETWRQFIADGPRAGDLLPEIRRADFAFRHALATHGVDALMHVTFTITDPQGAGARAARLQSRRRGARGLLSCRVGRAAPLRRRFGSEDPKRRPGDLGWGSIASVPRIFTFSKCP
jgi:hypothetical protein